MWDEAEELACEDRPQVIIGARAARAGAFCGAASGWIGRTDMLSQEDAARVMKYGTDWADASAFAATAGQKQRARAIAIAKERKRAFADLIATLTDSSGEA